MKYATMIIRGKEQITRRSAGFSDAMKSVGIDNSIDRLNFQCDESGYPVVTIPHKIGMRFKKYYRWLRRFGDNLPIRKLFCVMVKDGSVNFELTVDLKTKEVSVNWLRHH